MDRLWKIVIVLFLPLFFPAAGHSQANTLPNLPSDPAIVKGQLPNGLTYYFASNKSKVNTASYSLVQKKDAAIPQRQLREEARRSFADVSFGGRVSLPDFLGRHGILPTEKGYIECRRGAVVYTFDNISSAKGEYVLDTVLLSIFTLAQDASLKGQPSSSQAIVVAGDFKKEDILSRMKLLCLINPYVEGSVEYPEYKWQPSDVVSPIQERGGAVSRVSVSWRGARVPEKYMQTVFPLVSGKLSGEFEMILHNRMDASFSDKDVWFDFKHYGSADGLGDETVSLTLHCPGSERAQVKKILETELDRLYTYGVGREEYTSVRDAYRYRWSAASKSQQPNTLYLQRCISSFLYGASLANDTERIKYVYRDIPDSSQVKFFNRYLKGILEQSSRIDSSLSTSTGLMARESVAGLIASHKATTVLKAPKGKQEYITGGTIWTYSNGVTVIYKEMPVQGLCHFAYAVRGGRQWAKESNMKSLPGIDGGSFANYLSSNGIAFNIDFTPTDVRFRGTLPMDSIESLFSVLSALSDKKENEKVFGPLTYKLLVLIGDVPTERVRKMLCRHIFALGPSGKWRAAKPVMSENSDIEDFHHMAVRDRIFQYDVTTFNYAVSKVAEYALTDMLGNVFSNVAVSLAQKGFYPGLSLNSYRLVYGVRHLSLEHFPSSCERLGEGRILSDLENVAKSLAEVPVSEDKLKIYKAMAKDSFASVSSLPEFHINVTLDRYLDNKDITSRFVSQVDAVTAADVQKFFSGIAF